MATWQRGGSWGCNQSAGLVDCTWQSVAQTKARFSQATPRELCYRDVLTRAGLGLEVQIKGAAQTLVLTGDL